MGSVCRTREKKRIFDFYSNCVVLSTPEFKNVPSRRASFSAHCPPFVERANAIHPGPNPRTAFYRVPSGLVPDAIPALGQRHQHAAHAHECRGQPGGRQVQRLLDLFLSISPTHQLSLNNLLLTLFTTPFNI